MASRLDFSQIRSLYVGTSSSTQVGTDNLVVAGNVGIGTTSPAFTSGDGLEIQRSSATATLRLDSGVFATELRAYTDGTFLGQLSNAYLDLGTDNLTKVRITGAGNVLIGTTTDNGRKLNVNGDIFSNGEIYSNQYAAGRYIRYNWNTTSFAVGGGTGIRWVIGRIYWNQVHWGGYSGMDIEIVWNYYNGARKKYSITNGANGGTVYLRESQSYASTHVRVSLGSAVDTGTTSGGYSNYYQDVYLDVNEYNQVSVNGELKGPTISIDKTSIGGSEYGWATFFSSPSASNISTFTNQAATILSSEGNWGYIDNKLGINNSNPSGTLHVQFNAADGQNAVILRTQDGGGNGVIRWQNNGATNQAGIGSNYNIGDAGALEFLNGGTTNMMLRGNGNLLIGTTTDSGYKLAVNGSAGLALSSGGIVVASYDGNTGNIKPSVANGSVLISDDSGTTGRGTEFLNNGGLIASSTQSVVASFNSSVQDGIGWIQVNTTQQTTASGTSPAAIELVGLRGTSTHGRHAYIGAEGVEGTTYRTQIKFKIRPEDSPYQWSTLPTQMVIDGNGNVGIGTTAPQKLLHINGGSGNVDNLVLESAYVSSGVGVAMQFNRSGGVLSRIRGIDEGGWNGGLLFEVRNGAASNPGYDGATNVAMKIATNGNVGINTTNPTEKLDVAGNGKLQGNLYLTATDPYIEGSGSGAMRIKHTAGQVMYIRPDQAGNVVFFEGVSGQTVYMATATPSVNSTQNSSSTLIFETRARNAGGTLNIKSTSLQNTVYDIANNLSRFSITGQNVLYLEGNVGIGTTSPYSPFQVGAYTATGGYARGSVATLAGAWSATLPTLALISTDNTSTQNKGGGIGFGSGSEAGSSPYIYAQIKGLKELTGATYSGYLAFYTTPSGSDANTERMRITSAGNVGIGTTSPAVVSGYVAETIDGTNGSFTEYRQNGTALFRIGADSSRPFLYGMTNAPMDFYTNTSLWMRITAAGNVGIGTTSPQAKLHVSGTISYGSARFSPTSANGESAIAFYDDVAGTSQSTSWVVGQAGWGHTGDFVIGNENGGVGGNVRLLIERSGNVGIGTTSPTEKLHVDGNVVVTYNNSYQGINSVGNKAILARVSPTTGIINYAEYATAANLNGFVMGSDDARVKGNIATDSLEFITNGSTRMTVLSSGYVGVNTTTPGTNFHVVGDVLIQTGALGVGVNPSVTDGRIDASNDIVAYSSSDRRLKENITPIANALDKVKSLTGVEFDWKPEHKKAHGYEGHDTGVIAQEVQEVMPTAVRTNDTGYLAVRYEKLIGLLIEAVKEQQAEIDELKKLIK